MLFLAGLMGMALVGATVFISVDGGEESEDAVQPDAPQDTNISGFIASGTLADEVISGSDGADQINGYGGADTIDGGAGEDTLFGGWGDDLLDGREDGVAEQDFLNGGGGADNLVAGGEDIVTTGMGADNVFIGDWIMPGEEAQVHDFDPLEDRLIIVFDDQANASEPEITIARDGLDPDVSHILMNGEMIAAVHSEPSMSINDLMIMTQSDAALFFGIGETSTAA